MLGKKSHPTIHVLAAFASGAPILARALAAHSRLSSVQAGGPEVLAKLGPDPMVVHLVRDGRSVALARTGAASDATELRRLASGWISEVSRLLAFEAANPERVVKIAYEDLLASPHRELEKLCVSTGVNPELEPMVAALRAAVGEQEMTAFRADLLDTWQLLELEGILAPALTLLGYRPAGDLGAVHRIRREAQAYQEARAEVERLRAELESYRHEAKQRTEIEAIVRENESLSAHEHMEAMARELASLRLAAQQNEETLEDLRRLRSVVRDDQDLSGDIRTLRWKAKRYDQIRAAASPIIRMRRLRRRI